MKLIASSAARRRTAKAALRSFGGPQMPSPVRRIAPKPRRCTESSLPNETSPANLAETSFLFTKTSRIIHFRFSLTRRFSCLHSLLEQDLGHHPLIFVVQKMTME